MKYCSKYNSGMLRHRVEIQSKTQVSDGLGGFTETWSKAASSPDWASWEATPASERTHAMRVTPGNSFRMVTRYFAGFTAAQRVVKDGREYAVRGVVDPEGLGRWLEWRLTDGATS